MMCKYNTQTGYIVITTSLVIFSIGTLLAVSMLLFATQYLKSSRTLTQSQQAKALASACAELGVQKLITSAVFLGTVNQTLGSGSCSYTVTNPTVTTALISVTATVSSVTRKVQVNMNLAPLTVTKWQEVP